MKSSQQRNLSMGMHLKNYFVSRICRITGRLPRIPTPGGLGRHHVVASGHFYRLQLKGNPKQIDTMLAYIIVREIVG